MIITFAVTEHMPISVEEIVFFCFISAWQQHDVQELCRVMFDALESKFKNTVQV